MVSLHNDRHNSNYDTGPAMILLMKIKQMTITFTYDVGNWTWGFKYTKNMLHQGALLSVHNHSFSEDFSSKQFSVDISSELVPSILEEGKDSKT